jgi:hypothetical protein
MMSASQNTFLFLDPLEQFDVIVFWGIFFRNIHFYALAVCFVIYFFMVMPILIGGFGNRFGSLTIGKAVKRFLGQNPVLAGAGIMEAEGSGL